MTRGWDLLIDRRDLRHVELRELPLPDLCEGQALVRVDRVALTANNVTYAVFGEAMNYWRFFPAPDGFGRVPVWGFGEVVDSRVDGVSVGERFYGYWPLGSHLVVEPVRVTARGFADGSAHRADLPAVYNDYQRVAGDPAPDTTAEDLQSLFWPLFFTGYLLDDFLAEHRQYDAAQILLTSASSKTALSLAWLLKRRGVRTVGLTSASRLDFVRGVGLYDDVRCYADLTRLDPQVPTVSVDFAGDGTVLAAIHAHFGDRLRFSSLVGGTHWQQRSGFKHGIAGPEPVLFFAPSQGAKRRAALGGDVFNRQFLDVYRAFLRGVGIWLRIEQHDGANGALDAWRAAVDGAPTPDSGVIVAV